MASNLEASLESIKSLFNFDIVRRLFFLSGIAASVLVGIYLYHWIQKPIYRPLPYYIDNHNLQAIIQELDKNQINYQMNEASHYISVPISDMVRAKVALARAGIKNDNEFNFTYLNDQNKIGGSQFLENARYIRALEADLARTISDIQGINAAKVHLAIPQHNIFADEKNKPSASVIVNMTPGFESNKEKIRAIIQLIAASVPELDPTRVVITNQYGHDLSSAMRSNSFLNRENLEYQNNLQTVYEKKISSIITPIIGSNKASISVNINLDFTQHEEAKEEYNPDQAPLRSEQTISDNNNSSATGGVPGALSNTQPTNQPGAAGNNNQTGQNHSESIKNYEITKSMHYVKNNSPKIIAVSVAVVVDHEMVFDKKTNKSIAKPISKEKLDQLIQLVKSTIGFNPKRGDQVTVINSGFIAEQIDIPPEKALWEEPWFWEWSKHIGGMLIGFIFIVVMYRKFSADFKPKQTQQAYNATQNINFDGTISPEMMALKDEQIKIIKELVAKEPNKVAGIIKKWIAK